MATQRWPGERGSRLLDWAGGQWDLLDLLDASDAAELRCLKPCRMGETTYSQVN